MTMSTINHFEKVFFDELEGLNDRRKNNTPGPTRDQVIESMEISLKGGGLQPWQLYSSVLGDTKLNPDYRRTAVNLLHDPARVPEYAAQGIADTIIAVMQEQGLDYNLGLQTVMAGSILRDYGSVTPMLPISMEDIDSHFIPFIEQVSAPRQGQSQAEAILNHTAHTLASLARFTIVHGHAYDSLLEHKLGDFYKVQVLVKNELERKGKLNERGFYTFVHPMEHLAELMDQGAMTRDKGLVELLIGKGVVDKFNALEEQRVALGIQGGDVGRYKRQKDGFLAAAKGMDYKVN